MADPIRSSTSSKDACYPEPIASFDPDGAAQKASATPPAANAANAARPSASSELCDPSSSSCSPLVAELVRQFTPKPAAAPGPTAGNSNADRVSQTKLQGGYVDTGTTADGTHYVTAALIYGRDPNSGFVDELLSVSAQGGAQNEIQAAMVRVGVTSDSGDSLVVEGLAAQAAMGIHNKDGSTGLNVSGGANFIAADGTLNNGGNSLSLGVSVGASFEVSVGTRDSDHDGKIENCLRLALPGVPVSGGFCVEDEPSLTRAQRQSTRRVE